MSKTDETPIWLVNHRMDPRAVSIAKIIGWKFFSGSFNGSTTVERPGGGYCTTENIPDFLNDLNAAHQAELHLKSLSQRLDYLNALQGVVDDTCGGNAFAAMATASQRIDALLMVLKDRTP